MNTSSGRRARQPCEPGQSLVLLALLLPLLTALLLGAIEVTALIERRTAIEEALRQAARAAVQQSSYAGFAGDSATLAEPQQVLAAGRALLSANLAFVDGLAQPPAQLAEQAVWTVLPGGGECVLSGEVVHFEQAAVCVTLQPQLRGPLGTPAWRPQLSAAATLERRER